MMVTVDKHGWTLDVIADMGRYFQKNGFPQLACELQVVKKSVALGLGIDRKDQPVTLSSRTAASRKTSSAGSVR